MGAMEELLEPVKLLKVPDREVLTAEPQEALLDEAGKAATE
jgi:hypothetical protein